VTQGLSLVIWDEEGEPSPSEGAMVCWRSYVCGERITSVPRYLECHAERLRDKYLGFVHDLGEYRVAGKRIIDHLDAGDGFSFWWMTHLAEKSPFKSRRIYDCLRLLSLEEMLVEKGPSDVTLVSADRALAGAIRRLCDNLNLPFQCKWSAERKRTWSLRRCYEALPIALKGLISLRHALSRWGLRKLRRPKWFSGKNTALICSYFIHLDPVLCAQGRFHSRQWESLPKTLHDLGIRTNWVQLFMLSAAVPKVATGIEWMRRFNDDAPNQGCHAFLDGYLSMSTLLRALRNWLWLSAVRWKLHNVQSAFSVSGSAVWLWPILRDDWQTSLVGPTAINNCLMVELFDSVLRDIPHQPTGLYLCENQAWERALLHAWRKYGHGRIIGVQHATVPFWHLYYFDDPRSLSSKQDCAMPLPDLLAVNGAAARRAFADSGYPEEKLVEVEALRYLDLLPLAAKRAVNSRFQDTVASLAPGSRNLRVLVLGDMIPESMRQFLTLVANAVRLLSSGYEFAFKPHPAYAVDLAIYSDLAATETTESLYRILDRFDVAIAANSTSASVDAYIAGLPVIIDLSGSDLNLSPLRGRRGVTFVSTPEELAAALDGVRNGPSVEKSDRGDFFFLEPELPKWKALLSEDDITPAVTS
jgi:surface carbohydrate biosynthesis protein (TIGR04326 family)